MSGNKIGIIGLGAIGGYLAIKLKLIKYEPIIFHKNSQNKSITLIVNNTLYSRDFLVGNTDTLVDVLFVTVKVYDFEVVEKQYKKQFENAKQIIIVQSNINLYSYKWSCNRDKVYLMPFYIGVIKDAFFIRELCKGKLVIGKITPHKSNDSTKIKKILDGISKTEISSNLEFDMFLKVAINSALFPMCIYNSCSFGEAFKSKENLISATKIFQEIILIAKKIFIDDIFLGEYELHEISFDESFLFLSNIINLYYCAIPSLLIDIIKQHNTEISFFYSDLIDLANNNNINVPLLTNAQKNILAIINN